MSLTKRIFIAMFLGIFLGWFANMLVAENWFGESVSAFVQDYLAQGLFFVVGKIFIASLKVLVVPLVFVSLVCGVCNLGDSRNLGRLSAKTIGLYMVTTCIAISIALALASFVGPGEGADLSLTQEFVPKDTVPFTQVLINIFPSNPFRAMVEGNMLQIIMFALLLGYAITLMGEAGTRLTNHFNDWNELVMKMVMILMELAPYGVFSLLFVLFADKGLGPIAQLASYFICVVVVLFIHALLVYPAMLQLLAGLSPRVFLQKMRNVQLFAFSTSSSNASIPVTLRAVEKRLGVSNSIASFTVPLGATINMDGTAIMQGVATVFIAQAYGIDLTLAQLVTVVATATLASIGTAGVPGVGLVTLAMVLQQVGLPIEGIGLIIGVDRLLDMLRTAVNVTGDATVSCVVAKSEKRFHQDVFDDPKAGLLP